MSENQSAPTAAGGGNGNDAEFDLLSSAPSAPDISGRLKPSSGAGLPKVTLALIGVVLAVGGFVGGIAVGKSNASTSNKNANTNAAGAARTRGGFGGTGGASGGTSGQFARGGTVTGTVTAVNGTKLTVTDATGKQVTVDTSDQTTITIGKTGSLSDLAAGTSVTVIGTPGSNGAITARSVISGIPNLGFGGPRGSRTPSPTASSSGGSNG
ncbi:MAG: hypothetical protein JF587_05110 [Catenulisporales bacterium]|jgi:hypothetical protein|nr:hypothetical protein [Catenulisporales bacterium]